MRTNIEIDDALMAEALHVSEARTKREAVEMGLRMLIDVKRQGELRKLWGIGWEGDLEAMRRD